MSQDDLWFHRAPTTEPVRFHLVCFPGVGGRITAFQQWPALLPPGVEVCSVQLPGRGVRWGEPAVPDIHRLADRIVDAAVRDLSAPVLLFGFSFGGLLGYEVAARMVAADCPPVHYMVCASRAPLAPDPRDAVHLLDEARLVEVVRQIGATPDEVLDNPDLCELVLPALRADFEAANTYVPSVDGSLPVSLTAVAASDDASVTPNHMAAWDRWTGKRFSLQVVAGDHFVLERAGDRSVPDLISAVLKAADLGGVR